MQIYGWLSIPLCFSFQLTLLSLLSIDSLISPFNCFSPAICYRDCLCGGRLSVQQPARAAAVAGCVEQD